MTVRMTLTAACAALFNKGHPQLWFQNGITHLAAGFGRIGVLPSALSEA